MYAPSHPLVDLAPDATANEGRIERFGADLPSRRCETAKIRISQECFRMHIEVVVARCGSDLVVKVESDFDAIGLVHRRSEPDIRSKPRVRTRRGPGETGAISARVDF